MRLCLWVWRDPGVIHTDVRVKLGVVQVLNDLLDGRDRPVPNICERPLLVWQPFDFGRDRAKLRGYGKRPEGLVAADLAGLLTSSSFLPRRTCEPF